MCHFLLPLLTDTESLMKAVHLTAKNNLEIIEVPEPELVTPFDVLIRIRTVGVCGSDIHYFRSGRIGNQIVQYPFIPGHEGSGIVEAVGSQVKRVKPGDAVAIDPAMPCFTCEQCQSGRSHTCLNLKFLGNPGQAEGCLSEYLVMPETSLFPVRNKNLDDAALSEPLAIGYYAVEQSNLRLCDAIGILGFGPIGMSVLLAAKQKGACKAYITDKISDRNSLAVKIGADWTGNPDTNDIVSDIKGHEPRLLDIIFECCGQQEAVDQALDLLKPGGKIMIIGIPEISDWLLNVEKMRHKEITLVNVRRQNDCIEKVLELMDAGEISTGHMITHRFPLSETLTAFKLVSEYRDGVMKALIEL